MSATLIIDCSITMAWCFGDESTPGSRRVQDRLESESAVVPALWFLEVANVFAMAEKRRRITPKRTSEFLTLIGAMDIEMDNEAAPRAFAHLLPLCRTHRLTAYDAAYLELAIRRRLPLATLDKDLRAAAKRLGVETQGK